MTKKGARQRTTKTEIPKFPEGGEFGWCAAVVRSWGDVCDANHDFDDAEVWFEMADRIEKRKHTKEDLEGALMVLWQELCE